MMNLQTPAKAFGAQSIPSKRYTKNELDCILTNLEMEYKSKLSQLQMQYDMMEREIKCLLDSEYSILSHEALKMNIIDYLKQQKSADNAATMEEQLSKSKAQTQEIEVEILVKGEKVKHDQIRHLDSNAKATIKAQLIEVLEILNE
ncbi:hypothetical protein MIR68_009391 [Amoeboaphelidium protococcarum]|nr:hypothetical protein MIR68_009391 [Amoeboaphelidium protococcarum]